MLFCFVFCVIFRNIYESNYLTVLLYKLDHVTKSQTDNITYWLIPINGTNLFLLWTEHKVADDSNPCPCNQRAENVWLHSLFSITVVEKV